MAAKQCVRVDFDLILMGSALNDEFGSTVQDVTSDGFGGLFIEIPTLVVQNNHIDQARATAQAIFGLCDYIEQYTPDIIVTIADRFETMATAISASYSNIPLVHIQGGEISGNIDDKVRWAISMLADTHFPCSNIAYSRLVSQDQIRGNITMYGCPAMDTLNELRESHFIKAKHLTKLEGEFAVVSLHPNTEDIHESVQIFDEIQKIIKKYTEITFIVIKPNVDAGNLALRECLSEIENYSNVRIIPGLDPLLYASLLKHAKILIGNSSSLIREGAALGKPSILLGNRQFGRDLEENVTVCDELVNLEKIVSKEIGKEYPKSLRYGAGNAGKNIFRTIMDIYETK